MTLAFLSPIQTLRVLPFDVASHTVLFQGFNSHRKHFRSWVFSLHSFFHFGNQIQSIIPKQIFFAIPVFNILLAWWSFHLKKQYLEWHGAETIFETCSVTSGRVTSIILSGGYILFWLSWCLPKMKSQAWWKSQNPFTNLLGSLSRKYRGCHSKRLWLHKLVVANTMQIGNVDKFTKANRKLFIQRNSRFSTLKWEMKSSIYSYPPSIPSLTCLLFEGELLWSASASVQWRPSN